MNRTLPRERQARARESFPYSVSKASAASIERLNDRLSSEVFDTGSEENLSDDDDDTDQVDPGFRTDLGYDGYHSIEESDNNALNSRDTDRSGGSSDEIRIEDREEDEELGEESSVDPQGNRT